MSQDTVEPQVQQTGSAAPIESSEAKAEERKYSASEVEQIVKNRLTKEQKKHQKAIDAQTSQKRSGMVEENWRGKLAKSEADQKAMFERPKTWRVYRANPLLHC